MISPLSAQLTVLVATVRVECFVWMAYQAQQSRHREQLLRRLQVNGPRSACNCRRAS